MASNAIEGLAKLGLLIENKKATEQEIIQAISDMCQLRQTGLYKNWGFNALADNYEKFVGGEKKIDFPRDKMCCGEKMSSEAVATSGICYYTCLKCFAQWKVASNGDVLRRPEDA